MNEYMKKKKYHSSSLTRESGLSSGSLIAWYNDFIILLSC